MGGKTLWCCSSMWRSIAGTRHRVQSPHRGGCLRSGGRMRLLLVEDDGKLARALARGLRHEGHAVDVAGDGDAALLQAAVYEYDAIVLDVMLPGRDGIEVCRTLRERGCWVPVLMLTA